MIFYTKPNAKACPALGPNRKPAENYGTPLPPGEYICHLTAADLFNAKTKGTPGVKLAFKVIQGEHAGRFVWHDCWFTGAAMPQTKRDMLKLGHRPA